MYCRFIILSALLMQMVPPLAAEQSSRASLESPTLGWVWDPVEKFIHPLRGIPGASLYGEPLALVERFKAVSLSRYNFGLAVTADPAAVRFIHLSSGLVQKADPRITTPDRIELSPGGKAAALLNVSTGMIQILTGLPDAPVIREEFIAADLPMAISDDGVLISGDDFRLRGWRNKAGQLLFSAGSHDLLMVVEEENRVVWVRNITGAIEIQSWTFEEKVAGAQFTKEGRQILVAERDGSVRSIDWNDGIKLLSRCDCTPSGIFPLNGNGVFRLTEPTRGPLWLLDSASAPARIVFVPDRAPENEPNL